MAASDKKLKIAEDPERLSAAATRALNRLGGGRLCKQFLNDERFTGPAYWVEPSGRAIDRPSAEELIRKGRVAPLADGLFGEDAQSFEAL